jgi:PAS domain S-box-containing protein
VRFIGTVLDVTEKKRAGEALKRSEERYRAVIEQSTEGIYLLDTESRRLLETNHAFQKMFGYTAEELEGREIYDLVAHSRENVDANVWRTLELGRVLIGERSYRRKDGTVVEVEIGASTISYDGQRAICATVRDITARKRAEEALKRSEERFRSLVRYASDIIVIVAGDGEILYESPAVERVLGFKVEERVGTNAFDYLHPEDRGARRPALRRARRRARGAHLGGVPGPRQGGDWRHFEAVGVNRLEEPIIAGIVVNLRDVTERRRTERALEEIREAERNRIARELHDGVLQDLSYTAQAMEVTRMKCEDPGVDPDLERAPRPSGARRATCARPSTTFAPTGTGPPTYASSSGRCWTSTAAGCPTATSRSTRKRASWRASRSAGARSCCASCRRRSRTSGATRAPAG